MRVIGICDLYGKRINPLEKSCSAGVPCETKLIHMSATGKWEILRVLLVTHLNLHSRKPKPNFNKTQLHILVLL